MDAALDRCIAAIGRRLRASAPPALIEAVRAISAAVPRRAEAPSGPRLPVLAYWPQALDGAAAVDPELGRALAELSPAFQWRQNPNYVRREPGPGFLEGYGYVVIAGPGGLVPAEIAIGVLVLGPKILYPAHAHPAEEVYLVLDGQSRWWREGEEWRQGIAGASIHHPPRVAHAMQAGSLPLCAVYLWRGDLGTNAALTGKPCA